MSNEITIAPVSINVYGTTKSARQVSVVRQIQSGCTIAALATTKGKVGKLARENLGKVAATDIAAFCARGNYRPLAELIAAQTGEPLFISSRATYEALPDMLEAKIAQAKLPTKGTTNGQRTNKDGVLVNTAKLSAALSLKAQVVEIMARATQIVEQAKAQRAEQRAAIEG